MKIRNIIPILLTTITLLYSCGTGVNIKINNVEGPFVYSEDKHLVFTLNFKNKKIKKNLYYDIPNFFESGIELSKQNDQSLSLSFRVAISEILGNNNEDLTLMDIPFNREIPNVIGGSLPGLRFSIKHFNDLTMYSSPEYFGFFIPYKGIEFLGLTTFRYYLKGEKIGYISLVGKDEDRGPLGILLIINLSDNIKKELEGFL